MCPQGYYCEEGTTTPHGSPCPAGTAGEQLGQTSRAACKRCREGRFCPAGKSLHLHSYFTRATKTETHIHVYTKVTISLHEKKDLLSRDCLFCSPAQILGIFWMSQCLQTYAFLCTLFMSGTSGPGLPCARGSFCPAGTLEEMTCPLGTYTPHQGAISRFACSTSF